ncbi:MAG: hypothetical protein EBS90_10810 [Betaproteobacteria bacterium]|nr:hypothetical protein [Betaproteobacteria bacterium]
MMPKDQAQSAAGGVYNRTVNGVRYQVLFNTDDHWDHLHIGVAKRGPGSGLTGAKAPLTKGQQTFADIVSKKAKIDKNVVAAWMLLEENQGAAKARERDSQHNWLNIGWTGTGRLSFTYGPEWNNPKTAAEATVAFLKGSKYGASQGIRNIIKAKTVDEQIKAIAESGWAGPNSYQGGRNLRTLYNQITGGSLSGSNDAVASASSYSGGSSSGGSPSGGSFSGGSSPTTYAPAILKDRAFGNVSTFSTKPISINIKTEADKAFAEVLSRLAREFGAAKSGVK